MIADRYVLEEVLGVGGMATVWQATDQVLGREVAVKILSPRYAADPGFLARFEREARHAARLSHPRLVTVFDCGTIGGTAFIVMELVQGQTLRQVLDQAGPLPPQEAVAVAAAVCEALGVAHAAGLVHRDIKPDNIALSGGEVKVLDFGIARADDLDGTRTPGVLGTAAYMSPEQATGGPTGPPSDLYSLGCVLFEMLTGAPPFPAGSSLVLAYRHVHDDPGPPSALRPGLAPQLDAVTARLLAKDPEARPASAEAARAMLLAALNRDGTTAPPRGEIALPRGEIAPPRGDAGPPHGETAPPHGETAPPHGETAQPRGEAGPPHGEAAPPHGQAGPPRGMTAPPGGETAPPHGQAGPPHGQAGPPHGMTALPGGEAAPPHGQAGPPRGMTGPPRDEAAPPRGEAASPATSGRRRARRPESALATALAVALAAALAALAGLAAVLLVGLPGHAASSARLSTAGQSPAARPSPHGPAHSPRKHGPRGHEAPRGPVHPTSQHPCTTPRPTATPRPRTTRPPMAAAAATFVGNLEAGVADGQVTPQAGQDLYNQLQQLLFNSSGQTAQQIQQRYAQLVHAYDQHVSQGQITGQAARQLHRALRALATALPNMTA